MTEVIVEAFLTAHEPTKQKSRTMKPGEIYWKTYRSPARILTRVPRLGADKQACSVRFPVLRCPETEKPPPGGGFSRGSKVLLLRGRGSGFFVLAAEALDAAGGIHQLLLAGKERMAVGTDFNVDVAIVSRPGQERIPAGAVNANFVVVRMNGCLHVASKPFLQKAILAEIKHLPQLGCPSPPLITRRRAVRQPELGSLRNQIQST